MEKEYAEGFKNAREFIWEILSFIGDIANLILRLIVILGALTSFILLAKLFPDTALKLFLFVYPIFSFVFNIFIFIIKLFIGAVFAYLAVRFGFYIYDVKERNKVVVRMKREKYLDDLADKINKRLGRKK